MKEVKTEKVLPENYYTKKQWENLKKCLDSHPTPNLAVDLSILENTYNNLKESMPYSKIYFSVKTYPNNEIIKHLIKLGSCFDVASIYELDQVLSLGAKPESLSYGSTIKKEEYVKYAFEKGCKMFVTDSIADLNNISKYAPGSKVFFRILLGERIGNCAWPLSLKFGAEDEIIEELIQKSKEMGLIPIGLSFHVGSQQESVESWDIAIEKASKMFKRVKEKYNIELSLLNLGGGLPGTYLTKHPKISEYGSKIKEYLNKHFDNNPPKDIIIEPGRGLVADCAVLSTSIVLISEKQKDSEDRWVYIDAGLWNGLLDAWGEGILFPLYAEADGEPSKKFILSAANCDSTDIVYKTFRNPLPENIKIKDKIYVFSCGAYSASCCFVGFNGYPPVPDYVINSNEL
ncbi:MAG: type III PLP-dependent enzyme [archaeon]|nr:type III PLP-dependent enzyme [archaeon]